ncbi:MAG TPA: LysR family transcriptional regulator [Deltaproteobacteria bacterium]|mgnify:CR=1 FL=1|nr:LysR family transcriptional regulator [Deltaproteobacteria bacterium]HPR54091.1 LysR family transcriptional regulator [Deltaproteobacteria bacterium]HXK47039.1 LysR family transcriptional regulator [Deltaproteobacteria bacterium]
MNIHQVHIFNIAAKTLSITKTAKKMHLSQPSVSIQIKDLEDALNVRLFDRINRKITLTDAGKVFFEYSERLLGLIDEINAVMTEFGTGDVGRIVLGASSTVGIYVLPRFLGEFKDLFPKADIALHIQNRQEAVEQCTAGELDFAFMQEPPKHPDLQVEFFMKDELVIVCSPKHKWAGKGHLTMKTLSSEPQPIILREEGSGTRGLIEYVLKRYGIEKKVTMELSSSEGIKRAVEANLGIAVLSRNVIRNELKSRSLVALPIKDLNTVRDFYIVRNRKRMFMPLMMKFYEFILAKRAFIEEMSDG